MRHYFNSSEAQNGTVAFHVGAAHVLSNGKGKCFTKDGGLDLGFGGKRVTHPASQLLSDC